MGLTKKPLLACFFLIGAVFCRPAAAEPFTMISPNNPIVEDIRFLVRLSGRSFLSLTLPLSRDEVLLILDDVESSRLSAPALEAYDRVVRTLKPATRFSDGTLGIAASLSASPSGRVRTNGALPFAKEYGDTPPFLSLPAALFFSDTLQLTFEPIIITDPSFYNVPGSWGEMNIPYEERRFDMNMPLRSFAAAGGPWWNFQLGRDKMSFGTGHTGNMTVSDSPDYYDFARLSLFSPNVKYSLFISQMPLDTGALLSPAAATPQAGALSSTVQRYMYLHRLDLRFFEKFSLGVGEGIMAGNGPPELRYLSPLVFFHSFFAWRDYEKWPAGEWEGDMIGSLLSIDIDWAILPSLAFYGQGVMNEFALPSEQTDLHRSPNGLGFLAGLEYTQVLGNWRVLWYGEAVYTDPYLYTLSSPFAGFIWMRRLADIGPKESRYRWIGHPAGRDAILFTLGSVLSGPRFTLLPDISFKAQGEHTILWDWNRGAPYTEEHSPSGIGEYTYSAGLEAIWPPLPWLTLAGYLRASMMVNPGHQENSNETGLELGFTLTITL
jgi:hypothetical protein